MECWDDEVVSDLLTTFKCQQATGNQPCQNTLALQHNVANNDSRITTTTIHGRCCYTLAYKSTMTICNANLGLSLGKIAHDPGGDQEDGDKDQKQSQSISSPAPILLCL